MKEDAQFRAFSINTTTASTTPSYWNSPTNFHLTTGTNPFFRWVRWRLVGPTANGTAVWTFRIILSINPAPR
jgi:hypothetical protein